MTGVHQQLIGHGPTQLGHLTLDAPKTLNSLTREMVESLTSALEAWRDDPAIAAVFIDGSGDKAFCAGGDVQALRNSCLENPGGPCDYAENFFAREYRMNYILHTYPKPIVCWGHGVVMGGGLGILAGCSHRVVSERTRIGMPEVTIALFPDVGGSWFLNKMPGHVGRFLALTAANINAADALFCGLGTVFLGHEQKQVVLDKLADASWTGDAKADAGGIDQVLGLAPEVDLPEPQIEPVFDDINTLMAGDDLGVIASRLLNRQGEDSWIGKACQGFAHGSKLAASWIFRQLNESVERSLEEIFESELILGANIMRHPEFSEGVRALLVDKDRNPRWAYTEISAVPADILDGFFVEPAGAPSLNLPA